ncbi:MAG: hypothetical protein C5B58_02925 [Acidobacteria bacterium]|nr:MAG: hypothetical protein C5B58_02925 [Acidobacteriota bacterium]
MELERGVTISVMPYFRHTLLASAGIRLNSGVESTGDCFAARDDWRNLRGEELALLTDTVSDESDKPTNRIELFEIPRHLYEQWLEVAKEFTCSAAQQSPLYKRFVASVASFFSFKKIQVDSSTFDVVAASPPRQSALKRFGYPAGLGIGETRESPLFAINLGEESTSLIFLNLPIQRMGEFNMPRAGNEESRGRIAERFMASFPEYPVVRLILLPGEGAKFFPDSIVHDGYTAEKKKVDVVLQISRV